MGCLKSWKCFRNEKLKPINPLWVRVTKRNSFSVLQSDMSKHCETLLICLEMIHLPGRCQDVRWPLAVGFEGCGIRNALKGQNLINIATGYDISHPNPKHNWEHGISSMRFLRAKKPSLLNHWYYKRLRPPLLVGIHKRPNWPISTICQKGYFSIFPIT